MEKQPELCVEINKGGPSFLQSGEWTDCKFVVGAEPHQVVVGGYKLVMAMASPVFTAMFYGTMAEKKDPIPIVDVEPEIFKAMLQYIYTGNINMASCSEAMQLYYMAKKYMLHHLVGICSNYLQNNFNIENVCQIYEHSQLFEDKVLTENCEQLFREKTKEVLCNSSFKDAVFSTVMKIFSLDELTIDSEADLINAAALYISAHNKEANSSESSAVAHEGDSIVNVEGENVNNNLKGVSEAQNMCDGVDQATPEASNKINDTADKQQIRSVVQKIRFLTLTPQQYTDCVARSSLLTLPEDHAVLVNLVSDNPSVPMPRGFSTSRVHRNMVAKARSEAIFRYKIRNFSTLNSKVLSPKFYVRNLPWQIKAMPSTTSLSNQKSLGFFVQCSKGNESTDGWSCNAIAELRLICHKPGAEPFSRKIQHLFYSKENDWGFSHFISWENLLDPAQGYLQDDAITLEVHLTAEEPHGV